MDDGRKLNFAFFRKVVIALAICLVSLPAAFVGTVVLFPFWRWYERTFGYEAVGHSGPAEWCFWLVYLVILFGAGSIWVFIRKRSA